MQLTCPGYGKLESRYRIAERAHAALVAASGSHVRASDCPVWIDDKHSRRLSIGHAHHPVDFDRRAESGGQYVLALHGTPAVTSEGAGIFDQHHHAGPYDREAFRVIQGYGKLFIHDELLPGPLHVTQNTQIGTEIIPRRCLDVGMAKLP